MAELRMGIAMSHGPMVVSEVPTWLKIAQLDQYSSLLVDTTGKPVSYEELEQTTATVMPTWSTRSATAAQRESVKTSLARLREEVREAGIDLLLVIGDDQQGNSSTTTTSRRWPSIRGNACVHDRRATAVATAPESADWTTSTPAMEWTPVTAGPVTSHSRSTPSVRSSTTASIRRSSGSRPTLRPRTRIRCGRGSLMDEPGRSRSCRSSLTPLAAKPDAASTLLGSRQGVARRDRKLFARPERRGGCLRRPEPLRNRRTARHADARAAAGGKPQALLDLPVHLLNSGNSEIRNWIALAACCGVFPFRLG